MSSVYIRCGHLHNLFVIAGRITFIFMSYGHQLFPVTFMNYTSGLQTAARGAISSGPQSHFFNDEKVIQLRKIY